MNTAPASPMMQSEYLSALMSSMDEAIIASDENFAIRYWNKGAEKLFGIKSQDALGKDTLEVLKFHYPEGLEEGIRNVFVKTGFWKGQLQYKAKSGKPQLIDISARVVRNDAGELIGYVGVHRDVTEYDLAKTALSAFLSIISSSEDNWVIIDKDLKIAFIDDKTNGILQNIYGINYTIGENVIDKLPERVKGEITDYIEGALVGDKTSYQLNVFSVTGESLWLQVTFFPLKEKNGYITHACWLIRDITAQKKIDILNEQLYRSRKLFETFMENSPILSWITDVKGVIRYLNPSYLRTYNLSRKHIGKLITEVFPAHVAEIFIQNIKQVININESIQTTETWQTPDGADHVYQVVKFPIVSEGELFVGGWAIDITGEVELKESLTESLERLQESEGDLKTALAREHQLNELKSRFVSMASHEFRTPLTSMLSSTFLLEKYTTQEQQPSRVKHILRVREAIHHMNDLLDDFLSLGRIEQGTTVVEIAEIDFKELIYDALEELEPIKKKGQEVEFSFNGIGVIHSDKKLLKVIVTNLLNNAFKFSGENKLISIIGSQTAEELTLMVKDRGIGISKDDQKHLFESFYRARNAQNIQGTGLGLHIVKRYSELLNGSIALESKIGEGTNAILKLSLNHSS